MHLQDLPTQLWASVACSLPAGSVLNLELVCKEIWLKVSDPVVWVELFKYVESKRERGRAEEDEG